MHFLTQLQGSSAESLLEPPGPLDRENSVDYFLQNEINRDAFSAQNAVKSMIGLFAMFFACLLLFCACSGSGGKLDGKWVWSAEQNNKPISKGFFNLYEDKNGKVLGTNNTIIESPDPKAMAFVTRFFEGKRQGQKLSFTIEKDGNKSVNNAIIAGNNNELQGQTVQTLPFQQELKEYGEEFTDEAGKKMLKITYQWKATRFKEK